MVLMVKILSAISAEGWLPFEVELALKDFICDDVKLVSVEPA
jgi:hypothetical protein